MGCNVPRGTLACGGGGEWGVRRQGDKGIRGQGEGRVAMCRAAHCDWGLVVARASRLLLVDAGGTPAPQAVDAGGTPAPQAKPMSGLFWARGRVMRRD